MSHRQPFPLVRSREKPDKHLLFEAFISTTGICRSAVTTPLPQTLRAGADGARAMPPSVTCSFFSLVDSDLVSVSKTARFQARASRCRPGGMRLAWGTSASGPRAFQGAMHAPGHTTMKRGEGSYRDPRSRPPPQAGPLHLASRTVPAEGDAARCLARGSTLLGSAPFTGSSGYEGGHARR